MGFKAIEHVRDFLAFVGSKSGDVDQGPHPFRTSESDDGAGVGTAIFAGDSLGLDFLNSIATPVDTPVDWLDSGDGFLTWLAQAELVPADALDALRARAMPGEMDKVADQARALR